MRWKELLNDMKSWPAEQLEEEVLILHFPSDSVQKACGMGRVVEGDETIKEGQHCICVDE